MAASAEGVAPAYYSFLVAFIILSALSKYMQKSKSLLYVQIFETTPLRAAFATANAFQLA